MDKDVKFKFLYYSHAQRTVKEKEEFENATDNKGRKSGTTAYNYEA